MKRLTWIAWGWTLFILLACWFPANHLPIREATDGSLWKLKIPHFDKVVHFGFFAVFAILWLQVKSTRVTFTRVLLAGLGLALISEVGQAHPYVGRDAGLDDVVADLLGLIVATTLMTLPRFARKRQSIPVPLNLSPPQESSA